MYLHLREDCGGGEGRGRRRIDRTATPTLTCPLPQLDSSQLPNHTDHRTRIIRPHSQTRCCGPFPSLKSLWYVRHHFAILIISVVPHVPCLILISAGVESGGEAQKKKRREKKGKKRKKKRKNKKKKLPVCIPPYTTHAHSYAISTSQLDNYIQPSSMQLGQHSRSS